MSRKNEESVKKGKKTHEKRMKERNKKKMGVRTGKQEQEEKRNYLLREPK